MGGACDKRVFIFAVVWAVCVAMTVAQQSGCTTFVLYNNTLIYGGAVNPASSLSACQAACQATNTCVGIDWAPGNNAGSQCFLQSTQSGKVPNSYGVQHYDLNCNGTSSTISTATTISGGSSTAASTAASTTSPPACSWNVTQNTFLPGGTNNPASNLSSCQDACASAPNCNSVDFSPNSPVGIQCFLHDPSQANANLTAATGVNHYVLICPVIPRPPPKACQLCFELHVDVSSLGGVQVAEIKDVNNCTAACIRLEEGCAGVDFSYSTGCWIHNNASDFDQVYSQPGVIQTRLNRCPEEVADTCGHTYLNSQLTDWCSSVCYPAWDTTNNAAGSGGQIANVSGTDLSSCLLYCLNSNDCIGVDFLAAPGKPTTCVYYASAQRRSIDNITFVRFSNQYRLTDTCARNCSTTFQRVDNTTYHLIGQWTVNATSETDCLSQCRMNEACDAAQWTKTTPTQCVLANDYYDFSGTPNTAVVTLLFRINCPVQSFPATPSAGNSTATTVPQTGTTIGTPPNQSSQTTISTSPAATSTTLATATTPPTPATTTTTTTTTPATTTITVASAGTTANWQGCFLPFNNTNIFGGYQNAANSLTDCQSACVQNGTCQGVDFTAGNPPGIRCYLLFTQSGKNPNSPGTVHYDYICGNGSNSCFQLTSNTLIYQGTQVPSATTLAACYGACLQLPYSSCSSFEWDTNYNNCFIHNTQQGKYPGPGVNHYDRSSTC